MIRRAIHFTITAAIKALLRILCAVDASALERLPRSGPYMIVVNHVNFLEVPLIYSFLQPRATFSLVKEETWRNPLIGALATLWHAIPIKRGSADFAALGAAKRVFEEGKILIVAPEGTRTGTGVLKKAHGGAALLAHRYGVPVYPLAHTGGQFFFSNIRRLRRTAFRFHVGAPFSLRTEPAAPFSAEARRQATAEIMGRIAALLPTEQRGAYAAEAEREPLLLTFLDGGAAESKARPSYA